MTVTADTASGRVEERKKRWQRYPAYKESGVEWLGEVPAHWDMRRLKYFARMIGGGTPSKNSTEYWDGDIPWVSPKDMKREVIEETEDTITELGLEESTTVLIPANSVLVVVRSGILKHSLPVAINTVPVALNQDMKALRTIDNVESIYAAWMLRGMADIVLTLSHKMGATVDSIETEFLENLRFPLPPPAEQRAIAGFLDRETERIDTLIARKERLIELLQEKRTALISHAVTKGLDPDAPMQDSGVEWLGEVPAHWDVTAFKFVAEMRYGLGQPPPELVGGLPLIRATNVERGRISKKGMMYVDPKQVPTTREAILSPGEIIVVRSGAYTGDSAIVPPEYDGAVAGYDMVVRITKGHSRYFAWQLLAPEVYELQFGFHKQRAAQPHLNAEELKETLVAVPPLSEQRDIASYLDREIGRIDALAGKIQKTIAALQEYRTALISAAVTGTIDVRGEANGS